MTSEELVRAEEALALRQDVVHLVQSEAGPLEKTIVLNRWIFWGYGLFSAWLFGSSALLSLKNGWEIPWVLLTSPLLFVGLFHFQARRAKARLRELKENYSFTFDGGLTSLGSIAAEELTVLRQDVTDLVQHKARPLAKQVKWAHWWLGGFNVVMLSMLGYFSFDDIGRGLGIPWLTVVVVLISVGMIYLNHRKISTELRRLQESYPFAFREEAELAEIRENSPDRSES